MKTRVRRLVVALIGLLLATGAVLLRNTFEAQRDDAVRWEREILDVLPHVAQRIQDFYRVKVDRGRKVWEVSAREAQYFDDEALVVVTEPALSFFMKDGRVVSLRGNEGRVFLGGRELQRVELTGDIEVQFGDYELRTDVARYEGARDAIVAPGRVQISGADLDMEGDRMEIQMAAQQLKLYDNVRMTLRPGPRT